MNDPGLEAAIVAAGSRLALARLLGVTKQAVSQWDVVPVKYLLEIERRLGLPRHRVRPDLFAGYKRLGWPAGDGN